MTSVWNQLIEDSEVALDLDVRSQLLMQLQDLVGASAAEIENSAISSSDLAAIRLGEIDRFQLQDLVRIAAQLHHRITVNLRPDGNVCSPTREA